MFKAFEDLKPENVFLSATGYVKLVEFSLAKVVNGRTGATELPTPQLATQKRWNFYEFFVWAETPWAFLVKLLFFWGEIASEWKEEVTLSTSTSSTLGLTPSWAHLNIWLLRWLECQDTIRCRWDGMKCWWIKGVWINILTHLHVCIYCIHTYVYIYVF